MQRAPAPEHVADVEGGEVALEGVDAPQQRHQALAFALVLPGHLRRRAGDGVCSQVQQYQLQASCI